MKILCEELAQIAYTEYAKALDYRDPASGGVLTPWEFLSDKLKHAWGRVAWTIRHNVMTDIRRVSEQ